VRAAGFSINKRAVVVTRHNNAIISRQIIHQYDSLMSKTANNFPSLTMMSTTDNDDDDTDASASDDYLEVPAHKHSLKSKDNTDINKTTNQLSTTVAKSAQDFMFGANYMHINYLGTWGKSLKAGKYLIPLAAFFFVGVAVYPGSNMNVVSEQMRSMLERVLMLFHSAPLRLLLAIMFLPYMIVKGVINGSLRSLSDVTAFIGRISQRVISTPKASYDRPSISHAIVVAPIIEELVFRWGLWRLWKLFLSMGGNKEQSSNESDSDDSQSLSRWVIVSSVIFSAAHISNHLPVPSADEVTSIFPRKDIEDILSKQLFDQNTRALFMSFAFGLHEYQMRYRPIISAMFHCLLTYVGASSLLCPLFITHGIWAAVGAHTAWNVCAYLPLQIPLRLLIRLIRNAKERRNRKMTQDD